MEVQQGGIIVSNLITNYDYDISLVAGMYLFKD